MKKEYDFSKGVRGKFFRKNAKFRLPIYLDSKLQSRVEILARMKHQEVGEMVNGLLQKDIDLIQKYI